MNNKSFQLIRTTPSLTTNMRINISTNYDLYLESINSDKTLNIDKYKHYSISKENLIEDKLRDFYSGIPSDIAFKVKYDNDNNISYNTYDKQFDDIYFSGARYIQDKWYEEEFEYFAPLYIRKNNLPKGFIILRVDDPVIYDEYDNVSFTNKNNFRKEIIDKWKCVKLFDLTYQSPIGYFLDRNINKNNRFPNSPLNISFNSNIMSTWNGLDYNSGVYTEKYSLLDNHLFYDNPQFHFEKYITEGYKKNNIIFPNILNLNFLFNDTPCTPNEVKKYSMNRYYGFYIQDMEFVRNITSYVTPEVKDNIILMNNIFISGGTYINEWDDEISDYYIEPESINPFVEEWQNNKSYYIYINKSLYNVIRISENNRYYYKIVSNEILDDYWDKDNVNKYTVNIEYSGKHNIIVPISNEFSIDPYYDCSGNTTKTMFGDLYLINIDGIYHILKNGFDIVYDDLDINKTNELINKYYIQTDYAINSDGKRLEYWKGGDNSINYKLYNTTGLTLNDVPITFSVFKMKFCDIKDFDYNLVDTQFSDFNYEKDEYVYTDEQKLHSIEYRDVAINENYKMGKIGDIDQYIVHNVSSEYISSDELFMIKDNDLLDIWRKNPIFCKWGIAGSVDNNDYPYKLNITTKSSDKFNKTTDVQLETPNTTSKNMNYFYKIGNFYSGDTTNKVYYKKQYENIQTDFINENNNNLGNGFNLKKYMECDIDYFNFFFKNKMYNIENNLLKNKRYLKYSVFNSLNEYSMSETVFKGIKYRLSKIENIINVDNKIDNIIIDKKQNYNDYKISVILNDIYKTGVTYNMNGVIDEDNILPKTKNGIHIFINEKYKNIIVILNVIIPMFEKYKTFYNIEYFEPYGIYSNRDKFGNEISNLTDYNYQPITITANNYIKSINDLNFKHFGNNTKDVNDLFCDYVKYYYIKDFNDIIYTGSTYLNSLSQSTINNIKGWRKPYPPFLLTIEYPNTFNIIKEYYNISAVDGPSKNILNVDFNVFDIDEPLARKITNYNNLNGYDKILQIKNKNINNNNVYDVIYRYSGLYEPIFNNIELFNTEDFCYTIEEYQTGGTYSYGDIYSYVSEQEYGEGLAENYLSWYNDRRISPNYTVVPFVFGGLPRFNTTNGIKYSNILSCRLIYNIPNDAVVLGLEIKISRKTNINENTTGSQIYTKDNNVKIKINNNESENKALDEDENIWNASDKYSEVIYGGNTDLWGFPSINSQDLNNGIDVLFSVEVRKTKRTTIKQIVEVEYVKSTVYYELNSTGYTVTNSHFIGDNYKFDTDLDDFGIIKELIFSKVNDKKNILKFDNINEKNIYPMVDQFGYSYDKRFLFKTNWEKDFYNKTEEFFE